MMPGTGRKSGACVPCRLEEVDRREDDDGPAGHLLELGPVELLSDLPRQFALLVVRADLDDGLLDLGGLLEGLGMSETTTSMALLGST